MNKALRLKIVKALYRKEMTDILRDKKTLLIMILLPVVLYPLLMFLGLVFISNMQKESREASYVIGCESELAGDLNDIISKAEEYREQKQSTIHEYQIKVIPKDTEFKQAVEENKVDVVVTLTDEGDYAIYYDSTDTVSAGAASYLEVVCDDYCICHVIDTLDSMGLNGTDEFHPIRYARFDQAGSENLAGYLLGMIIPFLMISSILMGALYPAIDVTAGEKERGTLETMLTLPVSNLELVSGKFLSVSTVAVFSALLNIVSMGGSTIIWVLSAGIYTESFTVSSLTPLIPAFVLLLLCMLVFSVFMSAIILCICINTSSFKEAENLATPLLLVVMLLSLGGMLPNLAADSVCFVPVLNIAVLIRDIFNFKANMLTTLTVLCINLLFGFIAIYFMSRMYRMDRILYGDGMGEIHFFEKRGNIEKKSGTVPGVGDALILMAVAILLILTVGSLIQVKFPGVGLLGIQVICFGLPVFMAWYLKCDFVKLFSLRIPKITSLIPDLLGTIFLWAGVYLLLMILEPVLESFFADDFENLQQTQDMITAMSPALMIFCVGIAPGICEECLFRGFLQGTLKDKFKPWTVIIITAALFGLYHMSPAKFFSTGLLGVALGYIVFTTDSIVFSSLFHMLNNTFTCLIMLFPLWFEERFPIVIYGVNFGNDTDVMLKNNLLVILSAFLFAGAGVFLLNLNKIFVKKQ